MPSFVPTTMMFERALVPLCIRGIDHELIVHTTHANRANRTTEGNIRKCERRTGTIDRDDVRIILLVCGENERDDLRLVAEVLRKQRPDGTVDLTRGQNLLLARPPSRLMNPPGMRPPA